MGYNSDEPVFAGRYHFEPISSDWDRGRSGFTHLVSDIKHNNRKGVIKRAETNSKQLSVSLRNEYEALRILKKLNLGVPDVYDFGKADYTSKSYDYLVLEYINGIRVEKNIASLTTLERADILTQFLDLLSKAHHKGIVNGDVDLKHLFWYKDSQQLIVIDWGNAILDVDKTRETEFAYDLARTAEIIYSLLADTPPPATGTIALPDDSKLISGLTPIPIEFRKICKWAPRTPTTGARAPYTAAELLKVATQWKKAIKNKKRYQPDQKRRRWLVFSIIVLAIGTVVGLLTIPNIINQEKTPTPIWTIKSVVSPVQTNLTASVATELPEPTRLPPTIEVSLSPAQSNTSSTATSTSPKIYSSTFVLDDKTSEKSNCWVTTLNKAPVINLFDGFSQRADKYWSFRADKSHTVADQMQVDFSNCLSDKLINALSANVWVSQIEKPNEIGIFLEDTNGKRREYTIWAERINGIDKIYLRLRDNTTQNDYELLSTRYLEGENAFPHIYYRFSFFAFLEINNQGSDIFYLKLIPQQSHRGNFEVDPSQLLRADKAIRPALGSIKSIGLIIYGGETESAIWPLAFLKSQ